MHISNMLPVLLGILARQAEQNKVNKAAPGQDAGTVARQETPKITAAAVGTAGREDPQAARQPSQGYGLPDFLPLPLKSPLFTDSAFFIKNLKEDRPKAGESGHTGIFIRLRTENLGPVWISLAADNKALKLSFYTEDDSYSARIRETFPVLEEGLQQLGYYRVGTAVVTRPGIKDCPDINPGGKSPGIYLLDLEV